MLYYKTRLHVICNKVTFIINILFKMFLNVERGNKIHKFYYSTLSFNYKPVFVVKVQHFLRNRHVRQK